MIAVWLRRWKWPGFAIVYIWWICWIVANCFGEGIDDWRGNPFAGDHQAFYDAARIIRDGSHSTAEIYPQTPDEWRGKLAFRNPPFYALLYVPTAGFSYMWSAFIWEVVSFAALAFGIRCLTKTQFFWGNFFAALGFYPVLVTFIYGQNALLSFAVFALVHRLLTNGRQFAAGLAAGLLCYKPTLLTGLVLWGLLEFRRKWPCALGVVVSSSLLIGGSYLLIPDAWRSFFETLPENLRFDEHSLEWWKNQVPKGFWKTLLPAASERVHTILTTTCTLLGLVWFICFWRKHRSNQDVLFGAVLAVTLWTSSHALIYDWALLLVPAVLWWEHWPSSREKLWPVYAAVWFVMLLSTDLCWAVRELLKSLDIVPDEVPLVMISVPVVGWAGWSILRKVEAEEMTGSLVTRCSGVSAV